MNREQILGILYDLSLTIGGELDLDSLLTRTLQRLLFHTSFPVAVILADRHDSEFGISASLEKALGDYQLIELCGSRLNLSAGLLGAKVELLDDPALLAGDLMADSPQAALLQLQQRQLSVLALVGDAPAQPASAAGPRLWYYADWRAYWR